MLLFKFQAVISTAKYSFVPLIHQAEVGVHINMYIHTGRQGLCLEKPIVTDVGLS